ncbi:MAG: sugar phosphate isomerase/epimerase family protein [Tepidisphaeraceae bacterium]|jgi:sugar phosphate isomerase/epimerase
MNNHVDPTRRDLVKLTAGTVLATAVGGAWAAEEPVPPKPPAAARPKISSVSWNFHNLGAGYTRPDKAIEQIGELGFEGIELILTGRAEIAAYWTDATIDTIRKRLEFYKLQVPQFAMFQPVVEELTSSNGDERQKALDRFEAGCRIAVKLGAPMVNIVAPWARELTAPGKGYLPRYNDLPNAKPGEKFHIDIAPGFDWEQLWDTFVATIKGCLQRAKTHGLRFSIENHTHTMMAETNAFLRLWDAIPDPAFGLNLDIGWIALEREYPPVSVHKAGKHLMNVHMRDIDGPMHNFVHLGQGVMDIQAIAQALKAVRFQGFVSLEQDGQPGDAPDAMQATCRRYLAMMKEYLA